MARAARPKQSLMDMAIRVNKRSEQLRVLERRCCVAAIDVLHTKMLRPAEVWREHVHDRAAPSRTVRRGGREASRAAVGGLGEFSILL